MMRSPQPLRQILAADPTLASWQARCAREEALGQAVRRHLPRQLGDRVRLAESDNGEVELIATAGAVATAVRQRVPEVLAALRREGWQCSGLRVRVQVATTPAAPAKAAPKQVDKAALAPLAGLARELAPGPLKNAIARLLRRAG